MKKTKLIAVVLVVALLIGGAIGGTIAWLTDKTESVVNTFTLGDINITLEESVAGDDNEETFKMIPGNTITKDPKITVKAGSEACWLFVKMDEINNPDTYLTYSVITGVDGWTKLNGVTGVYYREVAASGSDQEFGILTDDAVKVKNTVTKDDLTAINAANPKLAFTAYAVQKDNIADAATAWEEINPSNP